MEVTTRFGARITGRKGGLAFGLCIAVVAIAFESIAVATAMPVAARELDGLSWYAWAFSLFLIGMLFATVAAGRLADQHGPSRPMIAGVVIFAAGLVVAATAPTIGQLMAGRFIQGLGSGTLNVATYVVIVRVFTQPQRPRMFSFISAAWVLPAFLGPPIAAWLTENVGWAYVFWAVLPMLAISVALVTPPMIRSLRSGELRAEEPDPEPKAPAAKPASLWAAALAALSVAGLQLGGQRLDLVGLGFAVAGIVGLLVSLPNLMPAGFLRDRTGLSAVILARGLMTGAFYGAQTFMPLMLVDQRGLPLVLAGGILTIGSFGWTVGAWIQARPGLRLRRDRIITAGIGALIIGMLMAAAVAVFPGLWVGTLAIGWILAGFGMGMAIASTSLAAMSLSPAAEQGKNASSLTFGESLGSSLFVGIGGSIFAGLHFSGNLSLTFGSVIGSMVLVAGLSAWMSLRIGRLKNEMHAD